MSLIIDIFSNAEVTIAFFALLSSIISIIFTFKALKIQREHNYKSVKPIAAIELGDYETDIFVRISNNGVGPLLIKDVHITNTTSISTNLIDIIPDDIRLNMTWNTFASNIIGDTIKIDHQLYLIQKKFPDPDSITTDLATKKRLLRKALMNVEIKLTYTDIYELTTYTTKQELKWFGRTLPNKNSDAPVSFTHS